MWHRNSCGSGANRTATEDSCILSCQANCLYPPIFPHYPRHDSANERDEQCSILRRKEWLWPFRECFFPSFGVGYPFQHLPKEFLFSHHLSYCSDLKSNQCPPYWKKQFVTAIFMVLSISNDLWCMHCGKLCSGVAAKSWDIQKCTSSLFSCVLYFFVFQRSLILLAVKLIAVFQDVLRKHQHGLEWQPAVTARSLNC